MQWLCAPTPLFDPIVVLWPKLLDHNFSPLLSLPPVKRRATVSVPFLHRDYIKSDCNFTRLIRLRTDATVHMWLLSFMWLRVRMMVVCGQL